MALAKGVIVTSLVVLVLTPLHLGAETMTRTGVGAIASPNAGAQRTGKERLGEKWKDEQRFDNCKVRSTSKDPSRGPIAAATSWSEARRSVLLTAPSQRRHAALAHE